MRIVTTDFTSEAYAFDVVQPVRRATDPEGTPVGEKMSLRLEGPVSYAQLPARRVAMTTYTGPSPGLPRVRDLLRAWAMTHGADTQDRPFEEYLGGVMTMLDEDAKFNVYWPLK
jgi:effector-binding domain-containing protein